VNKVNTKAEVRFEVDSASWLPQQVRERLRSQNPNRVNSSGELIVTSQRFRTQEQNLEDAFEKLQKLVATAEYIAPPRVQTEKPNYADEARLREKQQRAKLKSSRRDNRYQL